jgi:hypothetical protein
LFIIAGSTKIDLNCLSGDQHYTEYLWNSASMSQLFQNRIITPLIYVIEE